MLGRDPAGAVTLAGLRDDRGQVPGRHGSIGLVIDSHDRSPLVHVADRAEEQRGGTRPRIGHGAEQPGRVDRLVHQGGMTPSVARGGGHPPATGGIRAISSPASMTRSYAAYSWLMATSGRGGRSAACPSRSCVTRSATVALAASGTSTRGRPNASAYDAKSRTVTVAGGTPEMYIRAPHRLTPSRASPTATPRTTPRSARARRALATPSRA